jgi:hypothetical protein
MRGFNSEIEHKSVRIHIQTQDKGKKAHYIESIVYASGKVLASRKTYYTSLLHHPDLEEKIQEIVKTQHSQIVEEVSAGHFDHLLRSEEKS